MNQKSIRDIAKKLGLKTKVVEKAISVFIRESTLTLQEKKHFRIPGLGLIKVDIRKARKGRNPKTGQSIQIAAKTRVRLMASPQLKKKLDVKLKTRQEEELRIYREMKEKSKFIAFDPSQGENVVSPPLMMEKAVVEEEISPTINKNIPFNEPVNPMEFEALMNDNNQEQTPAQDIPMDVHAGNGAFQKEVYIKEIADETARTVQNRMLMIFGISVGVILIIMCIVFVSFFNKRSFYNRVKENVNKINIENNLTYEQIDMMVVERLKAMKLDMSQMKDLYKQELYAMQDASQKRISEKVMASVRAELKKSRPLSLSMPFRKKDDSEPYIRIIHYIVRKGDNLWSIAEKRSKNPYSWVGIYQSNGRKIKNPDLIYPGQSILIPIVIERPVRGKLPQR